MFRNLGGATVALGLACAGLAMAGPASAQGVGVGVNIGGVGIGVGIGNIALGYQDGYWDTGHHWHRWANQQQMRDYRNRAGNHFHNYSHDRDAARGRLG
jgi:hypothetical protein